MKLLTSDCKKIWLFDVSISDGMVNAGLACFLPTCEDTAILTIRDCKQKIEVPKPARAKAIPMRICNARLLMLF